jgi:pre-rRNA-processing protein TSR1
MDVEPVILSTRTDDADSLTSTNAPGDMANEQTWPTEEEMAQGERPAGQDVPDAPAGTTPRRIKRVPKGTSEYQAAWIVDDADGGEDDGWSDSEGGDEKDMVSFVIAP